jgi:ribonuclease-3 family protein
MNDHLSPSETKQKSTAALAFVGDAVYGLMVREKLCLESRMPAAKLHKASVDLVRCEGQARALGVIEPHLTGDERDIFMRGRNQNSDHVPKNAQVADYRAATGLEALFGYLYLSGQNQRIRQLFDLILS